ncbi:MAG: methyltransferase domain-containing protein, partial [Dehalococcoidia bacterium]
APQIYEEQKVPSMFRPLAEATLRKVEVHEGARVIDIACGTGIVARLVAQNVGKSGSVVGVDLNAGMIEVAKQSANSTGSNLEWRQGDVTALPFPDASFDLAFCQQGLQFFPDKPAALKEIRRVLAPGGSVSLTVWSEVPQWGLAIADGLTRYVSAEAAKTSLAPFAFHDPKVIKALFVEAGFLDIQMEILTVDRRLGPAEESIPAEMAGAAYGNDVGKLDTATLMALVKEVAAALQNYRKDDGFAVPHKAHLIQAKA